MLIGYARAATDDESLDPQSNTLQAAGCERIFTDVASGTKAERPGLTDAVQACGAGDVLVVCKLARLGRSLPDLVQLVQDLIDRGIGFRSLQDTVDTTKADGEVIADLFSSLAACERDLLQERTQPGRTAARARGRLGGRPRGVADEQKRQAALALKKDTTLSVKQICERVGISRNTYYKYTRTAPPEPPVSEEPSPEPQPRTMKVQLWLRVENNNKYVRGKKKARQEIESWVLHRYGMDPAEAGGPEYVLTIPYTTDEELDQIIYDDIWREADSIADARSCIVEGDTASLDDPDRSW